MGSLNVVVGVNEVSHWSHKDRFVQVKDSIRCEVRHSTGIEDMFFPARDE